MPKGSPNGWGKNRKTHQKGFQSAQGPYERNQDIPINWRDSKYAEIANPAQSRLITKKYKEYTDKDVKLLEEEKKKKKKKKKAKEQGEVKVKSSLPQLKGTFPPPRETIKEEEKRWNSA